MNVKPPSLRRTTSVVVRLNQKEFRKLERISNGGAKAKVIRRLILEAD